MGQYWMMLCLDNERRTCFLGKLAEVFYDAPRIIERRLIRDREIHNVVITTRPTARFELLPSHVRQRICGFLAAVDLDSLLYIILTFPHMAIDGQYALNDWATWAGKRIITIGDYARDLLPKHVAESERKRWNDAESYWKHADGFTEISKYMHASLYPRASEYQLKMLRRGRRHYDAPDIDTLVNPRVSLPEDAVLRNLTLKQYFRRCDNKDNRDRIFTFGRVILILTCWSEDPSTSFRIEWDESDVHGDWAGHRLDIVSAEMLSDKWEDVTEAVKEKIKQLCYESYMSEWEVYDAEASVSQDESTP